MQGSKLNNSSEKRKDGAEEEAVNTYIYIYKTEWLLYVHKKKIWNETNRRSSYTSFLIIKIFPVQMA